ncbi:hypothetical protein Pla110_16000 [Polystyrenella longa]|uniref:Uncharacterized protein n=1 Tax=Polystyrenella longa TaxID=2528007 RepID=A0A518CKX3_9PLAN|nr:hypothetical protein [Polystyrenella longa]QDU79880.1 hypothetical protein Pla110_16000 [Polystyrenella longa]
MFDHEIVKADYICVWDEILSEILDWPKEDIIAWIKTMESIMGENGICFIEPPLYWLDQFLTPESILRKEEPIPFYKYYPLLEDAINGEDYLSENRTTADWNECRRRVECLLDSVGSSLPDLKAYSKEFLKRILETPTDI